MGKKCLPSSLMSKHQTLSETLTHVCSAPHHCRSLEATRIPIEEQISYDQYLGYIQFSSVQSLSRVRLSVTPWIAACQASLFITNSRSSLKLTSIESVMPSSHLILGRPLLLWPPIPPSIRVFSNESTLHMRWPKYWSFSFSIIPSKEHPELISFRMDWLDWVVYFSRIELQELLVYFWD